MTYIKKTQIQAVDVTGNVKDVGIGGVNAVNSSTSPLNASGTFTGAWTDCSRFKSIVVSLKTDKDNTSVTGRFSGELIRDIDA